MIAIARLIGRGQAFAYSVTEAPPPLEGEDAMLSDFFLYSALGSGSGATSSPFGALSYPLKTAATTVTAKAGTELAGQIEAETAKVAAYDELLSAVTGFQSILAGFDFSDEANATAAAQDFVDEYNTLVGTIDDLTGAGGALDGDSATTQIVSSLQNELSATFAAAGSYDKLYQIGITPQTNGTLTLDSGEFATAYAADSVGVESLLTEAASAFDGLVAPYATGGGLIEATASVYGDNLLNLEMALPALEYMGEQTQSYANAQYASAIYQLYGNALTENLVASFVADSSNSFFA